LSHFCLLLLCYSCVEMMQVRLKAKLLSAVERLTEANVPSPRMNAELLL